MTFREIRLLLLKKSREQWIISVIVLGVSIASIFFFYWETFWGMVEIWSRSETFTHCFLVLPISIWLVWRKRLEILNCSPVPNYWMLAPIVFLNFVWMIGNITATNSVMQLAFVAIIQCTIVAVVGVAVSRVILFPIIFLFFAVPVGEFLLPTLMDGTANFTIFALRLTGIPVYRDGLQFVIPSGNWSVVEACSGVRYLIASLTVGTLFAYLNYSSNKKRLVFFGVSIIVPIFANWFRAYMIVLLGHVSGNTIAVGVDHIIYGWFFFGIVIISMFMIGIRWADSPVEEENKIFGKLDRDPIGYRISALSFGIAFLIALSSGYSSYFADRVNLVEEADKVSVILPEQFKESWTESAAVSGGFQPQFKNTSASASSVYASDLGAVEIYLGYYKDQNANRKLISSENFLVSSQSNQWFKKSQENKKIDVGGKSIDLLSTTLKNIGPSPTDRDSEIVVWQYYWINGVVTTSEYLAKIYIGFFKLLGRGDDSAIVILHTKAGEGRDPAEILSKFVRENYLLIDEVLRKSKERAVKSVSAIERS